MREIVLDTETTGFEPGEGHRIVEIGCLELEHQVPTGRKFQVYLNPDRDVPAEAVAVHGLDNARLKDEPRFKDIAQDFLDFIGDAPLVIHNAKFDMKFLNAELLNDGRATLPSDRAIDTLAMARKRFPGAQASLDALCRRFGIDNTNRTLHGALLDSELLAEVYLHLLGGPQREMIGSLSAPAAGRQTHQSQTANISAVQQPARAARHFPVPPAEQEAHRQFIAKLKNPVWNRYLTPDGADGSD